MQEIVLVTGGAGYIGSHVALALLEEGARVVVLDNLVTGLRALVPPGAVLEHGDVGNAESVAAVIARHRCTAVIHLAGSTVVPESVVDPLKYYGNNMAASRTLLGACVRAGIGRIVFSSTAAVYGNPARLPVDEDAPTEPVTPYGLSKLMIEWMLRDVAALGHLRHVTLRYFNVAGADALLRTGQSTPEATHLIKVACEVACGERDRLTIFGDDYPTRDGTCVRDFIHVSDLAAAHVAALKYLAGGGASQVLNCGYGWGLSVRDIIAAVERASARRLPVTIGPRRPGDLVEMVADSRRIRRVLDWQPRRDTLDVIVGSALAWERHRLAGPTRVAAE